MKEIIKALVIIPICLFLLTGCGGDTEYTSKDKYDYNKAISSLLCYDKSRN